MVEALGSGVDGYAVGQPAVLRGASVTATGSPEKHDPLRSTEVRPRGRAEVLRLLADGVLRIPIQATYPLTAAGVADAHRASLTGHAAAKLVVVP